MIQQQEKWLGSAVSFKPILQQATEACPITVTIRGAAYASDLYPVPVELQFCRRIHQPGDGQVLEYQRYSIGEIHGWTAGDGKDRATWPGSVTETLEQEVGLVVRAGVVSRCQSEVIASEHDHMRGQFLDQTEYLPLTRGDLFNVEISDVEQP